MVDNGAALEAVIARGLQEGAVDYEEIAQTVDALAGSGDVSLVPQLLEALERFLDEENFYGRDIVAGVLAGIAGVAALPTLLLAADRDLGDDQDGLTGRDRRADGRRPGSQPADGPGPRPLTANPVLTKLRPGLTRTGSYHAAPCERDSETWGIAAAVAADPAVTRDAVIAYYRGLLEDGEWSVVADGLGALLCADQRFDSQQVRFTLHGSNDSPQYRLEIAFEPDRRDLGCG